MKLAFVYFFLCLAISSPAQDKTLTKESFQSLLLNSFDDIFSEGKIEKLHDYYSHDFRILENGLVWNEDSVVNVIKERASSGRKVNRTNSITVIQFEANGNTAWGSYLQ